MVQVGTDSKGKPIMGHVDVATKFKDDSSIATEFISSFQEPDIKTHFHSCTHDKKLLTHICSSIKYCIVNCSSRYMITSSFIKELPLWANTASFGKMFDALYPVMEEVHV